MATGVGFVCVVSGKITEYAFFYHMRLVFDGPPHLSDLARAVEARVVDDGHVTDGSNYVVQGFEVLDLRHDGGVWAPVEGRGQLYPGCHLAALRHAATRLDGVADTTERCMPGGGGKALGMGSHLPTVHRVFNTLDRLGEGKLTLRGVLRSLPGDVEYAIDLFELVDPNRTGEVSLPEFSDAIRRHPQSITFLKELDTMVSSGGQLGRHAGGDDVGSGGVAPVAAGSITEATLQHHNTRVGDLGPMMGRGTSNASDTVRQAPNRSEGTATPSGAPDPHKHRLNVDGFELTWNSLASRSISSFSPLNTLKSNLNTSNEFQSKDLSAAVSQKSQ